MAIRCIICEYVPTKEETDQFGCCPKCGAMGIPLFSENDVEIKINWQEIRVLMVWAERWANHHADTDPNMQTVIYKIAERIEKQHAKRSKDSPITLLGEINQLKTLYGSNSVEQNVIQDPHPVGFTGPDLAPPAGK